MSKPNEPFIYRLKPLYYIHVLDTTTGMTRLVTGPLTFTRQDNETVTFGPEEMVIVPPDHYCFIANPVLRDAKGKLVLDKNNNYKCRLGHEEIRWAQEPFPLFPGEKLVGKVTPLSKWIITPDCALRLRATRDFTDGNEKRIAGQEWLFLGPGTYAPRVEVSVVSSGKAHIIKPHTALRVRARQACKDEYGNARKAGEEWLVREPGAYILHVDEELVSMVNGHVLTDKVALHLRATRTFVDVFGKKRKAGEEWLVTVDDAESYVCDVYEELVEKTSLTVLTSLQYCVVVDPYDVASGTHRLGHKEVRRGTTTFFLRPGERLEAGVQSVHVLADDEALLLRAKEELVVDDAKYAPGDRWMVFGPTDYVPPVQVEIVERRKAIPLDTNEGIYVRDITSGKVRLVTGQSYILSAYEELWSKELPKAIEDLLKDHTPTIGPRDKTRAVTLRLPHNTAMQVYDYKEKKQRVLFGPDLVMLGPDEQFSVLSLSGGQPKKPFVVKALWLMLGPEFMTDIVTVETTDHARLSLKLSYTWQFMVDKKNPSTNIFQVPDFVGDTCKAIASTVRTAVAASSFDAFHKNFATIIRKAVFGVDAQGKVKDVLSFPANSLAVTNVDIQSVEPIDQRTRDSLSKSVQLAIEITTKSQEAIAKHEAERTEQEARARLEKQKLLDEADAEKNRRKLKELEASNAAIETTGAATAEAKAKAAASEITGRSAVQQAVLRAEANDCSAKMELALKDKEQAVEIDYMRELAKLEVEKKEELTQIEAQKFKQVVDAIGAGTIAAIARAAPEMQAKLLHGLGLKSVLVADGKSPINLFNTATGLIAPATEATTTTTTTKPNNTDVGTKAEGQS